MVLRGNHLVAGSSHLIAATAKPWSVTSPVATRLARARRLSSPIVVASPAIIRLVLPAATSSRQAPNSASSSSSRTPPTTRPWASYASMAAWSPRRSWTLGAFSQEASDVGELGDEIAAVLHQEPEGSAGFHGRELRPVSDEDDFCSSAFCRPLTNSSRANVPANGASSTMTSCPRRSRRSVMARSAAASCWRSFSALGDVGWAWRARFLAR